MIVSWAMYMKCCLSDISSKICMLWELIRSASQMHFSTTIVFMKEKENTQYILVGKSVIYGAVLNIIKFWCWNTKLEEVKFIFGLSKVMPPVLNVPFVKFFIIPSNQKQFFMIGKVSDPFDLWLHNISSHFISKETDITWMYLVNKFLHEST